MKFPRTHATPTPFGPQRAEEIWAQRETGGTVAHAMTDGEDEYVHLVWGGMPDSTCYLDAFHAIRSGRVSPRSPRGEVTAPAKSTAESKPGGHARSAPWRTAAAHDRRGPMRWLAGLICGLMSGGRATAPQVPPEGRRAAAEVQLIVGPAP